MFLFKVAFRRIQWIRCSGARDDGTVDACTRYRKTYTCGMRYSCLPRSVDNYSWDYILTRGKGAHQTLVSSFNCSMATQKQRVSSAVNDEYNVTWVYRNTLLRRRITKISATTFNPHLGGEPGAFSFSFGVFRPSEEHHHLVSSCRPRDNTKAVRLLSASTMTPRSFQSFVFPACGSNETYWVTGQNRQMVLSLSNQVARTKKNCKYISMPDEKPGWVVFVSPGKV